MPWQGWTLLHSECFFSSSGLYCQAQDPLVWYVSLFYFLRVDMAEPDVGQLLQNLTCKMGHVTMTQGSQWVNQIVSHVHGEAEIKELV